MLTLKCSFRNFAACLLKINKFQKKKYLNSYHPFGYPPEFCCWTSISGCDLAASRSWPLGFAPNQLMCSDSRSCGHQVCGQGDSVPTGVDWASGQAPGEQIKLLMIFHKIIRPGLFAQYCVCKGNFSPYIHNGFICSDLDSLRTQWALGINVWVVELRTHWCERNEY